MTSRLRSFAPLAPVVGFVALFAVVPTALLVALGVASGGATGVADALSDPLNERALENSLVQGALSAFAAVAVGYPVGVLLGRFDWRGRGLVRAVLTVPFLLPTIVVVLGVQDLVGPDAPLVRWSPSLGWLGVGVPGIVLVNVLFNLPLVALLTAVGAESASRPLEESLATLGATPAQRFRWVWGPPSWVGAAAGGLLTFLFSALAFAAPLLLCGPRCYTLEGRIWSLVQRLLAPGEAAVLAGVMVALLLLPAVGYFLLVSRLRSAPAALDRRARRIPWRSPALWPVVAVSVLAVAGVTAVLASILARAAAASTPGGPPGSAWSYLFGPSATASAGIATGGAIANSLVFAGVASGLALLLGILAGFGRDGRARRALRVYLFVPLLVSPVVLAFGLATFWRPALGGAADVWVLILLGQATLALPFTLQSLDVALASLGRHHRESAQSLGASPFLAYLEAELPRVRPALVTAALFAFALGLGEFTATYFLATPSFTTVPLELYHFAAARAPGVANALAGLLVLLSLAAFLVIQRGGNRALL